MNPRDYNKIILSVGAVVLIIVLLNPPLRSWSTYDQNYLETSHHETNFGVWAGRIFAVIVATAVGWYLARDKTDKNKPQQ